MDEKCRRGKSTGNSFEVERLSSLSLEMNSRICRKLFFWIANV